MRVLGWIVEETWQAAAAAFLPADADITLLHVRASDAEAVARCALLGRSRTHYLHGYHEAVPPMALIALFAPMARSTNRSTAAAPDSLVPLLYVTSPTAPGLHPPERWEGHAVARRYPIVGLIGSRRLR